MRYLRSRVAWSFVGCAFAAVVLTGAASSNSSKQGASACQPKVTFTTLTKGVLNVVGPEYPPLFTYDKGKIGGVDGDILTQIARDACLKLQVQLQPAAGVIESVITKRADVAAGGWYITPERAKVVGQTIPDYSDPPELVSKTGVSDLAKLKGKAIGTTLGYLWDADLKKWAGSNAKFYQSPDQVFADVANGRIAAGLMAVNEASYRLKKDPNSGLKGAIMKKTMIISASERPSVTNFPHTKGNASLTKALNQEIRNLRKSGQLASILAKYGISKKAAYPSGS